MAYSNTTISDYTQLNTAPALSGIAFAVAAAVQFLDTTITIGLFDYTFDPAHAMVVSLIVLVIAFASSDTNDWRQYESWEQGLVAVAVFVMVGAEYLVEVSDALANNEPHMGLGAFLVSMAAWGVLSR